MVRGCQRPSIVEDTCCCLIHGLLDEIINSNDYMRIIVVTCTVCAGSVADKADYHITHYEEHKREQSLHKTEWYDQHPFLSLRV